MKDLKSICVLGAGTMGAGIAQWFVQSGCVVELADISTEVLKSAEEKMFSSWDKLESKGKFSSDQVKSFKNSISFISPNEFSKNSDLVVEAIIENLEVKNKVFAGLNEHFSKETIFASNTSSIPIDAMAKELSVERRRHFLGLHFFNPAPIMKLVEVIGGYFTDEKIVAGLYKWFTDNGKKPARCKDGPGFIVNRVARNFYGEPFRIIKNENLEKQQEIDSVLKSVGGFRMGPFELMDLIGVDVNFHVSQSVWQSFYCEERFAPHAIQRNLVQSGRFGRKTGKGFYDYE